jgi:cell division septation protein DedD
MNRSSTGAPAAGIVLVLAALLLPGCAGTSAGGGEAGSGRAPARPASGESAAETPPVVPAGKFTVQLGAFESEDGAAGVASLARTRFARDVNTVYDPADGLYKVMLGVFDTKDEARSFRDAIVRQYPAEYMDAWVSDLER